MQQIRGKNYGDADVIKHIFDLSGTVNAYL